MKKFIKNNIFGFILGFIIATTLGVFAATLYAANQVSFVPGDTTWNVTNVEDAINDIKTNYISKTDAFRTSSWVFEYTGNEESLTIPYSGTYKLEVWGAQGGTAHSSSYYGGYGAYSVGEIHFDEGQIVFINVGEEGKSVYSASTNSGNAYNGGGAGINENSTTYAAGGGGATHIALTSGTLSGLSNNVSDILIVAGAGGGGAEHIQSSSSDSYAPGGNAGGIQGNSGSSQTWKGGGGGSQTAGGTRGRETGQNGGFGYGGYGSANAGAGGGSGFYGGGGGYGGSGGGGSSYIGNSLLTNKAMYCYSCTTSNVESTKTVSNTCVSESPLSNCSKQGNGYAKITLISLD